MQKFMQLKEMIISIEDDVEKFERIRDKITATKVSLAMRNIKILAIQIKSEIKQIKQQRQQ